MNIIGLRKWFYGLSLLIILPGIASLIMFGLRPSIDFTGGTMIQMRPANQITINKLRAVLESNNLRDTMIQQSGNSFIIRTKPLSIEEQRSLVSSLESQLGKITFDKIDMVGPTVSAELVRQAIILVVVASLLIILYLSLRYKPVFAICGVIALLHDVLVITGLFSIFGVLFHAEVDSLFVTAVLSTIGYSMHDSIIIFDRIRENMKFIKKHSFEEIANFSTLQTISRSINTSFTVVLVLLSLLIFGSPVIKWFIIALLIGIISGTYSSIFNATALVVDWTNFRKRMKEKSK
ncbi:protein translocase subunit SecF [Thermodesulfobium sp.]